MPRPSHLPSEEHGTEKMVTITVTTDKEASHPVPAAPVISQKIEVWAKRNHLTNMAWKQTGTEMEPTASTIKHQ